jgi:hypothetical protein
MSSSLEKLSDLADLACQAERMSEKDAEAEKKEKIEVVQDGVSPAT